jgi:hypothetical protein
MDHFQFSPINLKKSMEQNGCKFLKGTKGFQERDTYLELHNLQKG